MKKQLSTLLLAALLTFAGGSLQGQIHFSGYSQSVMEELRPYLSSAAHTDKNSPFNISDERAARLCLLKMPTGEYALGGLMEVENPAGLTEKLHALSVTVETKAGNIWSVRVPLTSLNAFCQTTGIRRAEWDAKVRIALDKAKKDTEVDKVHAGTDLPKPYKGTGVILGIIDSGFDSEHPTFYDKAGNLRIKTWWQQDARTGNPPPGFNYGTVFNSPEAITQIAQDNSPIGHGTHVAGIAGGTGNGTDELYTGVAPEADFAFVSLNSNASGVVDAVKFLFDYAEKARKPIVINMSLGLHEGPKDGTSLVDKAFQNLVGKGKVLVGALGNEGMLPMHIGYSFNGDTLRTIPKGAGLPPLLMQGGVEIWGKDDFKVGMVLLNSDGTVGNYIDKFYSPVSSAPRDSFNISAGFGGTSVRVFCNKPSTTTNGKGHVRINFNATYFTAPKTLALRITAPSGEITMWNLGGGTGEAFTDTLAGPEPLVLDGYRQGDNRSTMREIGGTGPAVISVGAYTTLNRYKDADGNDHNINMPAEDGEIAPFSSRGPAADGRTKPDLTAPGNVVASAFSSFDRFSATPENIVARVRKNGKDYPFGVYEGTSMASPMVAGAVALILQVNPNLTAEEVKNILISTARQDNFTGALPENGDFNWGKGKLNVHAAVKKAAMSSVESWLNYDKTLPGAWLAPNPAGNYTVLQLPENGKAYSVSIYDLTGKEQFRYSEVKNEIRTDTGHLPAGVYIVKITDSAGNTFGLKLIKE